MNVRRKQALTVGKLAVAAVVSVLLFLLTINAMRSPVSGDTQTITAEFSDVSGLGVNGDVRTGGVRIGKVEAIDLVSRADTTIAQVRFSLLEPRLPTDKTKLSVKYQNLTGVRFIDVDFGDPSGQRLETIPMEQTVSSFDITELFNGLQPVLTTMNNDEINQFMENTIAVLQGDGSGLEPMLNDLQRLADHVENRESVISTLVDNLARISDSMGGRSEEVVEFIHSTRFLIDNGMSVLDEFPKTATAGPEFLTPVVRMMDSLGLHPGLDIHDQMNTAFGSLSEAIESLRLLPSSLAGLQMADAPGGGTGNDCAHGVAQLPTDVQVFLNGSGVRVCSAG